MQGRSERPERRCEVCGETFSKRAAARYWGQACKQEAYRRRLAPAGFDDGLAAPTLADLANWFDFGRQ
jgi:hypothetical protein